MVRVFEGMVKGIRWIGVNGYRLKVLEKVDGVQPCVDNLMSECLRGT